MNTKTRLLIKIAQRRVKPGTGSAYAIAAHKKDMEILHFITTNFMLIGGHATALYMPQRQTLDFDILVKDEDELKIEAEFLDRGATITSSLTIGGKSYLLDGQSIDAIACSQTWFDEAYTQAVEAWGVKVIPLPYLVLLKMQASRMQDLADCSRMLGLADNLTIHKIEKVFLEYAPNDLEDLNSLIELGKLENS